MGGRAVGLRTMLKINDMNQDTILLALAILPVIVLATFVYRQDKFKKEPFGMLVKAFLFGCLSALPAILLENFLMNLFVGLGGENLPGFVSGIYNGYVVAGFSEELCKLLLLSFVVWKSRHFDEYFDGIVYAAFVSLGFAGLENVMYVFSQETYGAAIMTGGVRAILSVPGHFLFGVTMGYYFALAKFQPERRADNLFKALLFPMLLHGTFDALLMVPEAMGLDNTAFASVLFIVFIYFDIRLWKAGMRRLNHLQQLSEQQANDGDGYGQDNPYDNDPGQEPPQQGDAFSGFNWNV